MPLCFLDPTVSYSSGLPVACLGQITPVTALIEPIEIFTGDLRTEPQSNSSDGPSLHGRDGLFS